MRTCLLLCGALALACVDRPLDGEGDPPADEDPDDEDVGERPGESDGMYAACGASAECAPLDFCVFPSSEQGYCTDVCASAEDPSLCDPSPGGAATEFCLDIGIPSGARVCALDCGGGKSCPGGMRCEGIETDDGERRVCF
jgi:hypothetical protein